MERPTLIELQDVAKTFPSADGAPRTILEGVDFRLAEGEIVALLGKSGSGKSTMLRIIAGLVPADAGCAAYRGHRIGGPVPGIAMVFQSFALFPWLTVRENVELGLEAQGMPSKARERRSDAMLDLIGLGGFGGALPRELSGGMRQRVGIARALVTDPDVLLMDEAFSALDVLTGETLRGDILELWDGGRMPTRGMLIVSHNIEEAVMMADRIVVLSSDPGRVRSEIRIPLPRPRDAESAAVRALVDQVYALMTMRPARDATPGREDLPDYRLPPTDVARIESVLDLLAAALFDGRADLPRLAEETDLADEELFPTCEALALLRLARVERGDISLTRLGRRYAAADNAGRQELFGRQVRGHAPLVALICERLENEPGGALPEEPFLDLLEESLKDDEAERALEIAIEWGRYGELFEYDFHTGRLALPAANA